MNDRTSTNPTHAPLDHYETALLGELRQLVAERAEHAPHLGLDPAPLDLGSRRPRHVRRLLAGGAVAGLAASVAAVVGLGSVGGSSPAYAVEKDGRGDVVVTIHRLEDAAGLEKALRAQGIDADVSFNSDGPVVIPGGGSAPSVPAGKRSHLSSGPRSAHWSSSKGSFWAGRGTGRVDSRKGHLHSDGNDGKARPYHGSGEDKVCAWMPRRSPATLEHQGQDWVLTIPARSPLQNRHVDIGVFTGGDLAVSYAGNQPGSLCGVATVSTGPGRG